MIKVTIDREECISCAMCWTECPECFEDDEDMISQIVEKYRVDDNPAKGEVPSDLMDCVTEAADSCPVEIIHLETIQSNR